MKRFVECVRQADIFAYTNEDDAIAVLRDTILRRMMDGIGYSIAKLTTFLSNPFSNGLPAGKFPECRDILHHEDFRLNGLDNIQEAPDQSRAGVVWVHLTGNGVALTRRTAKDYIGTTELIHRTQIIVDIPFGHHARTLWTILTPSFCCIMIEFICKYCMEAGLLEADIEPTGPRKK